MQTLFEMNPASGDVLGQLANAVSDFQRQVDIVRGANNKMQMALAETQADLALTQTKLKVTETRLAQTTVELVKTKADLSNAMRRIDRLESDRDKLELGQVAFTYEFIMVSRVRLPSRIRSPNTVKELETLLREDWSERADDEAEKEPLRQQQTTARDSWETVRSQYLADHKIRDAIRLLKRLRVGSAHPFVDLSDDTVFEKVKGEIRDQFGKGDHDDLILLAERVRQLQSDASIDA